MFKSVLCALALGSLFAASVATASMPTAAKGSHAKVPCAMCHQNGAMSAPANTTCFQCHQSVEAVASKTEKLNPNPHFNHRGNQSCSNCHKMHQPSRVECNDCHSFNNLTLK